MGAYIGIDRLKTLIRQQYNKGFGISTIIDKYEVHFIFNHIEEPYSFALECIRSCNYNVKTYLQENTRKYDGDDMAEDSLGVPQYNSADDVEDFTENCKLSFSERLKITQLYL